MSKIISHGICAAAGLVVGVALGLVASFVLSPTSLSSPSVRTTELASGDETLAWFASNIDKNDPQARERILRISNTLKSGELSADEVDGIPILAKIVPAWWLARKDIYQISVIVLGRPDRRYSLELVKASGQTVPLQVHAEETRVYPLAEGVWRHLYQAYVDANGSHVDDGEAIRVDSLGISKTIAHDLDTRFDLANELTQRWKLYCGKSTIPIARQPR